MATSGSPDSHIEAVKRRLVHLSGKSRQVNQTETRIADAARHRLDVVTKELATLRPLVHREADADERYQALTLERGQLSHVIAQAQEALS